MARLKQIGALGYREVESAGYYNHSASDVKQAMSGAGPAPGERALFPRQSQSAAGSNTAV